MSIKSVLKIIIEMKVDVREQEMMREMMMRVDEREQDCDSCLLQGL